jgi:phage-related minor tail protein
MQLQLARVMAFSGMDAAAALAYIRANPMAGRASGGPVSAGTPYVVGEQGPELFVPTANGSIVPNGQMGNRIGTSSVASTVNINVNAGPLASAADTGAAVLQALKAYERRNGALPLKVA